MTRQEFDDMMALRGIEMPGEVAYRVAQLAADWERQQCAALCHIALKSLEMTMAQIDIGIANGLKLTYSLETLQSMNKAQHRQATQLFDAIRFRGLK